MPEPRIFALSALTLFTRDMGRATWFYGEVLGLPLVYGGADSPFSTFRMGGLALNLQFHPGPISQWGRFILYCDDVDRMWFRLRQWGFEPEGQPRDAPWGERFFHLRDPDGHEISFAAPLG